MASLSRWLQRRQIQKSKAPKKEAYRRRLSLESLEERVVPDANIFFGVYSTYNTTGEVYFPFQFSTTGTFQWSAATPTGQGNYQITGTTTSAVQAGFFDEPFANNYATSRFTPSVVFPQGLAITITGDQNVSPTSAGLNNTTVSTTAMAALLGNNTQQPILATTPDKPFQFSVAAITNSYNNATPVPIPNSDALPFQLSSGQTFVPNQIAIASYPGFTNGYPASYTDEVLLGGIVGIPGLTNGGEQLISPYYVGTLSGSEVVAAQSPDRNGKGDSAFTFYSMGTSLPVVPFYQDGNGNNGLVTFSLGGVQFSSSSLHAIYDAKDNAFNVIGAAQGVFDVGSFNVNVNIWVQNGQILSSKINNGGNYSFQLNSFQIGSQVFNLDPIDPVYGLVQNLTMVYNATNSQFSITGTTKTDLTSLPAGAPGGTIIGIGQAPVYGVPNISTSFLPPTFNLVQADNQYYNPDPASMAQPLTITNGVMDSWSFPVQVMTYGGLSFQSSSTLTPSIPQGQGMVASYDKNNTAFDISGAAQVQIQGGAALVNFAANPPGFVVSGGTVNSISFSVQSLKLGGVTYTPAAVDGLTPMAAVYDPNSQSYSFIGGATALGVNADLGADGTTGFVLDSKGNIQPSTFYFNTPSFKLANTVLSFPSLLGTYNPSTGLTEFQALGQWQLAGQNIAIDGTGSNYIVGIDQNGNLLSTFAVTGTFAAQPLQFTPAGLTAIYSQSSGIDTVSGNAFITVGGQVLPATFGTGQGMRVSGGGIASLGFTTPSITVAGVEIDSTSGFTWTYNPNATGGPSYSIQGNFNYTAGGMTFGPVTGNFVYQGTSITQVGSLTFPNAVTLDRVSFAANALSVVYDPVQNDFAFSGTGVYFGQSVQVGGPGQATITIVNGNLQLNGFSPPPVSNVDIPGAGNILIDGLQQVNNADGTITITGSTTLRVGSAVFSLNLGGGGTGGLIVSSSLSGVSIVSIGAQLVGSFTVGNVAVKVESMTFTYVLATQTVDISGTANATIKAASQTIKVELQLGDKDKPGIVIVHNQLQSLEASISSDFTLFGVKVHVIDAGLAYDSLDSSYAIFGTVTITTAKKGGKSVLDNFGVSLGSGPDDPGIDIVDGSLQSLDIKLDGTVNLGSLTAKSEELELKYDAGMSTLQITGGLEVTIANKFTGEVVLTGDGLLIDTSDGSVKLKGLEIKIADVKVGSIGIQDLEFDYSVDDQGNTTIAGSGMVSLPGGITVGGSFEIDNGQLASIGISFARTPGIPIGDVGYITSISGKVTNLNDLANFQFTGTIVATVGPSIKIYNKTEAAAVVTGTVTINSQMMELDGNVVYLGGLYGQGSGKAIIYFTGPNLIHISGKSTLISIPPYGSVLNGEFDFDLDKAGDVTFNGGLTVTVPSNIPKIGGTAIGTLQVYIQLRPEQSASNSYAQFTASVTVIFDISITLKVDLTGDVQGHIHVSIPVFPDINADFGFYLPGTRSVIVDNGTTSQTYTIADDDSGPSALPPTLALTASPVANTPEADIDYTGTTSFPSNTTIDLYADTSSSGYHGQLIAADVPFQPGRQEFTWNDFAEFAAQPYDPSKPIYFYGVIKDGTNPPVFTSYSAPVVPPNYDPSIHIPNVQFTAPNQPVIFSDDFEDNIVVTDPMAAFDSTAQVEVDVHANMGTLQVTNFVDGVTASGLGSGVISLIGTAADVNEELDGLTYTPETGSYFPDSVEVAVSRYRGEYLTPITSSFAITIDPMSIVLGDPNAGNPNFTGTPQEPGTLGYTLGGGYQPLLEQLQIEDAASNTVRGATVAIGSYIQGQEVLNLPLAIQQQTGVTATFDPSTGTLYLTGSAPLEMYQIALDDVLYSSSSDPSGHTLTVNVGDDTGNQATFTIAIEGNVNNSPPVIQPSGNGLFYTQGDAPTAIDPGIGISNLQGGNIVGVVINFTPGTYVPGEDELVFTDQNGITGTWDPVAGALTLSGTASASDYTLALESVQYVDLASTVTPGVRELTVNVINDNTTNDLATTTLLVLVSATPTAPQPPVVGITGSLVAAAPDTSGVVLDPDLTVTDAQSSTILSASVAITSNYSPGEDVLNAKALFGGIQESFDVDTGVLTLTGEAPVFYYQLALASVTYTNLVQARSGLLRTLTYEVNDGLSTSPQNDLFVSVALIPVVQAGYVTTEVNAGQTGFTVDPTIAINYSGSTLSGATVTFNGTYFSDEDQLQFTNQPGITGSFNSSTGVLTLSGVASVADYQTALQSVQYFNSRFNPMPGGREVDFTVSDGSVTSKSTSAVVNVDGVDVPPTLAPIAGPLQFVEGAAAISIAPAFTIQDPDAGIPGIGGQHTIYGATVTIDNYVQGEDILTFTPTGNITGTFNSAQGTLTLSGADSEADYATVLKSVQYQDVSEAPVTTPRVLEFSVNDGDPSGGLNAVDVTINVQSLMNPPTQTSGGTPAALTLIANADPASLGLGGLNFAPPSSKEPSLVYTITQVPDASVGQVVFTDGTVATVGQSYTLQQIQSAKLEPALNGFGAGSFTFTVAGFNPILSQPDPAELTESVDITVNGIATNSANQAYVAQLFRDLLGRNANANDLAVFGGQLDGGATWASVAQEIQNSNEYAVHEIQVFYQELLHRSAESGGQNFFLGKMQKGESIDQVMIEIAASPEFFQTQGGSTAKGYVDALYKDFLDRGPESGGESFWLNLLSATGIRAEVAQGIFESLEAATQRTTNLYEDFLRRSPDAGGLAFGINILQTQGEAALVTDLVGSTEYHDNCSGANNQPTRDLLAGLSAAGLIAPQTQDEQGDSVVTTGFPSVGTISFGGQGVGGGTLIAPQFVLTAAHVVDGRDSATLTFTVGGATYSVAQVIENPAYNPGAIGTDAANDIAILKLVKLVTNVTPSPINTVAPAVGDVLTLVGFGARGGDPFGVKHSGTTAIGAVGSTLITWTFANNSEDDTVVGDSGSPQFIEQNGVYYIASIASGGTFLDSSFGDNPYNTRVDVYQTWIESIVGTSA